LDETGLKRGDKLLGSAARIHHRAEHPDHIEDPRDGALIESVDVARRYLRGSLRPVRQAGLSRVADAAANQRATQAELLDRMFELLGGKVRVLRRTERAFRLGRPRASAVAPAPTQGLPDHIR
jgi:hypothetical protein